MKAAWILGCAAALALRAAPAERTVTLADGTAFVFVAVPAGKFMLGSPDTEAGRARDEGPRREVAIPRPYWLGKYEVTQAQWRAVTRESPSTFREFGASDVHPVEGVSWEDAQAFVARLNARGVGRFRLPTEAEWEYAARAGTDTRFPWGEDPLHRELPRHGWFYPGAEGRSHPVGTKLPNAWGLHDLLGGVWEWCEDRFAPYGAEATGTERVIRGGSWFNEPEALRPANRHRHPPDSRQTNVGLRLVWEPPGDGAAIERRADGTVPYGYRAMTSPHSGPWRVAVPGHVAPAPGEHPRLLFRRADLPALRAKAATPEGRAILQRLRFLLDGADGETMTTRFNPATRFDQAAATPPPAGTYTIGHASGYGLLYQLTGDRKFAEFGRESFERALAGTRDRDSRYSFRQPGGALRAGPTLGWMAVGYDLCYDGWDPEVRERLGRALWEYRESLESPRPDKREIDLPALARGTMPPYSNHFSMQVGGAALVLLALKGEPWIEPDRIEPLLDAAAHGMVRNLDEGFGDGGFFAEGDGTGSMASQIVFLSALQAWRQAAGLDFVDSPRPNARMLTLKWIYQTVFREGQPAFWPIRGGYGQNVWSRSGLSGAAYFALGMAAVAKEERGALQWCYERFLAAADAAAGTPFDTASLYPQFAVSAFVNWPVGETARDPNGFLPRAYRDATAGFFCWRDRWADGDDTVITVLTNEVRGYMGAKPDPGLMIHSRGRRLAWGTVVPGPVRRWETSPRGETSVLELADGTVFGVDLSGAGGAGVLLVTSGSAEGRSVEVAGRRLTFFFPTADTPPPIAVEGEVVRIGDQTVAWDAGRLVFGRPGR